MKKQIILIYALFLMFTHQAVAQAGYMGKKNLYSLDFSGIFDVNKHLTFGYWHATSRNTGFILSAGINYCKPPADIYSSHEYIQKISKDASIIYEGIGTPSSFKMIRVGAEYVIHGRLIGMAVPIGYFYKYGLELGMGTFTEKGILQGTPIVFSGPDPTFDATKKYQETFNLFQFNFKGTFGRNFLFTKEFGVGLGVNWNMIFSRTNRDSYGTDTDLSFGGAPFSSLGNVSFRSSLYDPYYNSFGGKDARVLLTPYMTVFYLMK